jgi:hypothetical protein
MDKIMLWIFQREVDRQTRFALMSFSDLEAALKAGDMDRIWHAVQGLLVAAGNVSKLLWPSQPSVSNRGEELRLSLAVPDDSKLAPRTFRNHFEHFDERLEQWATSSPRKGFADSNVGPTGMISGPEPGNYLRNLDTTQCAVTFRGDTYLLKPLVEALSNLYVKAAAEAKKPNWE